MPDVFISYQSNDRASATLVAQALAAEGYDPWWDPELRGGQSYDAAIEQQLRAAPAVIVLWSPNSTKSQWVRGEATIAQRRGVLLPVLLEPCELPVAFELLQTADLTNWWGDREDWRWRRLIDDVAALVAPPAPAAQSRLAALAPLALAAPQLHPRAKQCFRYGLLRDAAVMALACVMVLAATAVCSW